MAHRDLTPNPALQPTAASALRLLAFPSSLCSSAAAEGERLGIMADADKQP